ncbi:MAG: family 16 glycosylhydrolase [Bacteroidales bacterium]|nr:family 16 glycosylhydrolase [Bacteroidales bacterium]
MAATLCTTACDGKSSEIPEEVASLTVSPSSVSASWDASSVDITVTANCDWGVSAADKDWCSVSPSGGIKGTSTVKVNLQPNRTGKERKTAITFRYGQKTMEIPVSQALNEDDLPKPAPAMVVPDGYELVWNEEFESPGKPSTNDWWYETGGGGWGNNESQVYVAGSQNGTDLAFISDGTLKIQAKKIGGTVYSIRMNTKRYWQYGWFEARIKVSDVPGSWPAFWMMPQNYKTWPGDGEIDIMEYAISTQGKDKSSSSIHCNAFNWPAGTQKTHVQAVSKAAEEFHVYALEWTAKYMKFYVDGKLHLTFNNDGMGYDHWPFDAPFYLKFNMAWGGNMGGKTDESKLPATYEVDYVRVFKKK